MDTVTILDKEFRISIESDTILAAIKTVADKINSDTSITNPLFLAVLNGSFMFAADLLKHINFPCEVSFVKLASYSGMRSTGDIRELIGLHEDIAGRTVIVLEDIIDSGKTLDTIIRRLTERNVGNVKIATMLFKPDAFKSSFFIDYIALTIPNDFIVGHGLDYDGYGRNLKDIYTVIK